MNTLKATCSAAGCDRPRFARGMCQACYNRAYRSGSFQLELPIARHSLTQIDEDLKRGVCAICGPTDIRVRKNRVSECMALRRAARERDTPEARRRYKLKRKYGLTQDEFMKMVEDQNGSCAICGETPEGKLHIDHDHQSGLVRGLLCRSCNMGLGFFRDSLDSLESAKIYLTSPPAQPL